MVGLHFSRNLQLILQSRILLDILLTHVLIRTLIMLGVSLVFMGNQRLLDDLRHRIV